MTMIKRFLALIICGMMVFTLTMGYAEGTDPTDGTDSGDNPPQTTSGGTLSAGVYSGNENTLKINKTITVTNIDANVASVFGPNITYSYSITPVEESQTTVTDGTTTVEVFPGVAGAVTSPVTVPFHSEEVSLNQQIGKITKTADITFTPAAFGKAGIFRYKVTDTTENNKLMEAGVIRADGYKKEYWLDVYVGYKNTESQDASNLEIQGFVFLNTNESVSDANAGKLDGFTSEADPDAASITYTPVPATGDLYPTFNVIVTKQVKGTMADIEHKFPISLEVTNLSGNQNVNVTAAGPNDITNTQKADGAGFIISSSLKHNQSFQVNGLNIRATILATETNDTASQYSVTIKGGQALSVLAVEKTVNANESASSGTLHLRTDNSEGQVSIDEAHTRITFINALDAISPTGIVRYVAPYSIMLTFAFFMFILAKKRRKEAADEES